LARAVAVWATAPAMMFAGVAASGDIPDAQRTEVQQLLAFIDRSGCVIDRNGVRHPAAEARPHIEKKYEYFRDRIRSTEDFIALAASRSTLSDKPYEVECPGKPARPTRDWLLEELQRIRSAPARAASDPVSTAIVHSEFIFLRAPFAQCHASTLAESGNELVAAWFGGRREKSRDVGIWVARRTPAGWSAPVEVANGEQGDGERLPSWNPVLFQPANGPLLLFYKVGPDPSRWWGLVTASTDHGRSWNAPERLPHDILGPAKNKPIELADGTLLSPSSSEQGRWRVHVERNSGPDRSWQRVDLADGAGDFRAIQPALLRYPSGRIQLLARSREDRIVQSWSDDAGRTWSQLSPTVLSNPNSGIDAVALRDGRALLVYNPTQWRRSPLRVAISGDGGRWRDVITLEQGIGEYSYPSVIQTRDGLVHITYTWRRERIRHVVLDPARISG
jgi:predicted neuraminidase